MRKNFIFYRKIQDGRQGSKVQNRPNLTPQITFRLSIWLPFIRFGQILAWTYYLTLKTSLRKNLSFIAKSKMAAGGQRSKIDQIWAHKSHFGLILGYISSDFDKIWHGHTTWPLKQVCARISHLSQNSRCLPGVKGPKSTKFDPTNHILARHLVPVRLIWTNFGMDILLDPSNKPAQKIFIYRKIQDGRR